MDLVIFTGSVRGEELREERAAEYERSCRTGALDPRIVPGPSPALVTKGHVVGTIGLALGLALVALIIYAAAWR